MVVLSIQLWRRFRSACTMTAGLHKETLPAARAQAAALCSVLQGADVPVTSGLLEVHVMLSIPAVVGLSSCPPWPSGGACMCVL